MIKSPIIHVLKHDYKALSELFSQLKRLETLQSSLNKYLEPELAKHCHVVRYENNRLIVITDTGSWATKFQYRVPDLLEQLKNENFLNEIKAICCKTRPPLSRPPAKIKPPPALLSKKTAEFVVQSADKIDDILVRNALKKIATHSE